MSLEIGKKYFGILHLNEILSNTPTNVKICLHTKYGNIYIYRVYNDGCFNCCGDSICMRGLKVHCCCKLIAKYNKQNKKVLEKFYDDACRILAAKEDNPYNFESWKEHFNEKLNKKLNEAI